MIDLHIHSTMSDGLKTPSEILLKSSKLGLSAISITDHNSINAYNEIKNNETYKGLLIKGCEFTCMLGNLCIELLGYQFDIDTIEKFINLNYLPFSKMNVLETNLVIEALLKTPLKFDKDKITYDVENEYGNRGVHRELVKHPENKNYIDELAWNDPHEFSLRYLSNERTPYYVNYSSLVPSYLEVIKTIKSANGLVFLPHIYKYRDDLDKIYKMIIKENFLDGIECYHSSFSPNDTKSAIEIAREYNLYISGGTDTHGYDEDDEVKLGIGYGNMCIPDEIITPWVKKLVRGNENGR